MTWYDGGPAPDPRHDDAARAAAGAGRARLRAAAGAASSAASDVDAGDVGWSPPPAPAASATRRGVGQDGHEGPPIAGGPPSAPPGGPPGVADLADDEVGRGEVDRGERLRLADLARWRVAPRTAAIALGALLLVGGAVVVRSAALPTGDPVVVEEPAVTRTATADGGDGPTDEPTQETTVWVHVVGQVASPGVVALPAGSRVGDAVAAAGGALPEADLAGLNLAAVVQDGAQIRVPAPGEEPADAGGAVDGGGGGAGGAGAAGGVIDVNTAGSAELQTLPGIGPVLAERIVAWREANGPFASVDALLDVSGIGPAVLGQIRELVRV